jgi:hypothetical protein
MTKCTVYEDFQSNLISLARECIDISHLDMSACTKTRNNRNETTGTTGTKPPEQPEQESEKTGTTETKIEHGIPHP